jgi:hypothetical protein
MFYKRAPVERYGALLLIYRRNEMKLKSSYGKIIIFFIVFLNLSFVKSASGVENPLPANVVIVKEFPLPESDDRVISGNSALEKELAEKEKELDDVFEKYKASLMPHLKVLFDESQLDWEDCMRDEIRAFQTSDKWTRANPKAAYENLYRLNLIKAVNWRKIQIENFKNKRAATVVDISKLEAEMDNINDELDELNYRVTVWTTEQLRYRVYRAMRAWNRYYESSMVFFRALYPHNPEKIVMLETELLRYRFEYMKTQREALYRLKFESEDI